MSFEQEPGLEEDETVFLSHLWAAYAAISSSGLLASLQGEAPFLKAGKERETGGKGLIEMNDLGESFSRRHGLPAALQEYRRLRMKQETEAELAILSGPPIDVEALRKACRSFTPSASKR